MQIKLNSKKLLSALNLCAKAVNQNGVLATACYRFKKLTQTELEISACNMEISITAIVGCDSLEMFDLLITAKDLDIVKTLADQPLTFTFTEQIKQDDIYYDVELKSANGKYKMQGYDGSNFPTIVTKDAEPIELDFSDLYEAVSRTAYTRLSDTTENALNGLSVELSSDGIDIVAFNGVSFAKFNISGAYKTCSYLFPNGIVQALLGLGITGVCQLSFSDNSVTIISHACTLKSLLLSGKFIDWKPLLTIPSNWTLVNRMDLMGAIKRVLMFSDKTTNHIAIHIKEKTLTVKGEDTDLAKLADESIVCSAAIPINIGVNGIFAVEALSKLTGDEVYLYYSHFTKPLLFRESQESINMSLLAPVIIKENA